MTLSAIILIVLIALILMLVEILVIPGTGFLGILSLVLIGLSIYFAYKIDNNTGHIILITSSVLIIIFTAIALNSKTWKKLMLNSQIKGKIPRNYKKKYNIGDKGKTISNINPIGKAIINNDFVEVKSRGDYIDSNVEIEIIDINDNEIIVKKI